MATIRKSFRPSRPLIQRMRINVRRATGLSHDPGSQLGSTDKISGPGVDVFGDCGLEGRSLAIQSGLYRYMRYGVGSEQLQDHQNDSNEWTNVAGKHALIRTEDDLVRHIPEGHSEDAH